MSENNLELKQCTRCHSTCTLEYFEKNRKGEYFSTCNNCRKKRNEYNKKWIVENPEKAEQLRQKQNEQKRQQSAMLDPTVSKCPACHHQILNRNMEHHQRRFPCHLGRSLLKHGKQLCRFEWLYDNDGSVLPEDQQIIDDLKTKNPTVYNCSLFSVAWTEEELQKWLDKNPGRIDKYVYCWKFNHGYSNYTNT